MICAPLFKPHQTVRSYIAAMEVESSCEIGRFQCGGFIAWLLRRAVHIAFLVGSRNRVQVLFSSCWNWFLNARDARLITGSAHIRLN